ncbi:MAG: hypothetical protein K0S65_325 [Labilithrix sp.]|nr:hypothetical protein [Labilithrix sp.]
MRLQPLVLIGSAVLAAIVGLASCAQSEVIVARDLRDEAPPLGTAFTPPAAPDSGDAQTLPAPLEPLCIATECPFPYTTCPTTQFGTSYFKCQVNLLTDNDNCGACGHSCQDFALFGTGTRCMDGECVASCNDPARRNCNGIPDDGCEVDVRKDPRNCGSCGNVCAAGVRCIDGHCGCPANMLECDGACIDPSSNVKHCGSCGNECELPADAGELPPEFHMEAVCRNGACGQIDCVRKLGEWWTDCNNDRQSDGCEVNLALPDANHCGACGNVCAPGEPCVQIDGSSSPPKFECGCKPNETKCGADMGQGPDFFLGCANLLTDINNCGACGYKCPDVFATGAHRLRTCNQGLCQSACEPGWGDCNGILLDGCETNLNVNPGHCGTCGNRCDVGAGQPCIDGRCLTEACADDAGVVTK